MADHIKQMNLLSPSEIEALYARPIFNGHERKYYFSLSQEETMVANHYAHDKTRLYFILQLGYFKAKQQFFSFDFEDALGDVDFIQTSYFKKHMSVTGKITRAYIKTQRDDILKLYGYHLLSYRNKPHMDAYLRELIKTHPKSHNALRQLMTYFDEHKIMLPTYRSLQDMLTDAYGMERKRLNHIMISLPENIQNKLECLIKNNDGVSALNVMHSDQKDFQYTAIKIEVEKVRKISSLYRYAQSFMPKLGLSKNAVRYYANLTEQYPASRLRRLSKPQQWLQLICFVHHRYQQFMDNMITSFIHHIRSIIADGKDYAERAQVEYSAKLVIDFPKLAKFLRWFPEQKSRPNITYAQLSAEAYAILPEDQFVPLSTLIAGNHFDKKAA